MNRLGSTKFDKYVDNMEMIKEELYNKTLE